MAEEKKFQTTILNDLRSLGKYCECFKIERSSDNGIPDIFFTTALTGGIFIETKSRIGIASKIQKLKVYKLSVCGCQSFICKNWEEWFDIKKTLGLTNRQEIIDAHDLSLKLYDKPD